jgi:hypothetical protein
LHFDPAGALSVITIGQKRDQSPHVIPACVVYNYDTMMSKDGKPTVPTALNILENDDNDGMNTSVLPIHYDCMMIDNDSETIYLLGDRFSQDTVRTKVVITPSGQLGAASTGQPRGFLSYSGDVVAIPEGNRVLFYRVPCADEKVHPVPVVVENAQLVRTAFAKDGSFFAASTTSGDVKILSHAPRDGKNMLVKLDRESKATPSSPAPLPTPKLTIASSVVKDDKPQIGSILQVKSWYDSRGNERSLFALGNTGILVRLVDAPVPVVTNDSPAFTCTGLQNMPNQKKPFSFFLTPTAKYTGLITPSGVFIVKHDGVFQEVQEKAHYLPPPGSLISAYDLHPADANARAMGTSTGAVHLEKKGLPKTAHQLLPESIQHLRYLDLRKSPKSTASKGLSAVVAASGKTLSVRADRL